MLEKILKHVPIYSALLIFMGYWNLHFYYRYFDIDIYGFVNTSEIIVSFLPIILDILIVLGIFFLYAGMNKVLFTEQEISDQLSKYEIKNQYKELKHFYTKDYLKTQKWYGKIIIILLAPMNLFSKLFLMLATIAGIYYAIIQIVYYPHELYRIYVLILAIFFFAYVFFWIDFKFWILKELYKKYNKNLFEYFRVVEFTLIILGIITLSNYTDSQRILSGKPDYFVSFNYKDSSFVSNADFVYIGRTQNYFFMRDISKGTNFVFPNDKVEKFIMKKNYIDKNIIQIKK